MLSPEHQIIHNKAIALCKQSRRNDWLIVEILQQVFQNKIDTQLEHTSLFQYSLKELELAESVVYAFITVTRKSLEVPELSDALREQRICVTRSTRIASVLTSENAGHLISFAKTHTQRETDLEVARINSKPKPLPKERARVVGDGVIELKIYLSPAEFAELQRAQALEAQKQKPAGFGAAVVASVQCNLHHNDPVRKAQRATERSSKPKGSAVSKAPRRRVSLKAAEKHAVHHRDGGRCTYVNAKGERCTNDRYLHLHHIRPVSEGGGNEPENLCTVCAVHHDLLHQLEFQFDGLDVRPEG